jgi:toxin ParE1/3/4
MAHRLAPEAERDLDEIAHHIAKSSGSAELAERHIDAITNRFYMLAEYPWLGRAREDDLGPGMRSFPVWDYMIVYEIDGDDVHILRVPHGRRNLAALFSQ